MAAPSTPAVPGRFLVPELPQADLRLALTQATRPPCWAQATEFQTWQRVCASDSGQVRRLEAKYAPWLCRFCLGFATVGNEPCELCEATGLSMEGRRAYPFPVSTTTESD